jgi:K+-sensing histidine kinase KdpD
VLLGTYFILAPFLVNRLNALRSAAEQGRLSAESERLQRTLLDSVSHELKTPISVLLSAGEQVDTEDQPKRLQLAVTIRLTAQRLDSVVTNLLNQTRLESGAIRPKMELCDSRDLIEAAQRTLGLRLQGRQVKVDLPLTRSLLYADPVLMEQALANLLLNAAIHTPAEGLITVTGGRVENPPRDFVCVADKGPGISPALQEKIFNKFQSGGGSGSRGLGLGLSIVRGFMRAQGGEASMESGSSGSQFIVFLPVAPDHLVPNL